ncbi:hypothetical protein [Vagococcus zengguangii]|uniref:Uncharacterized protein n=1 Tax=Vagococcus zengguangii TaxID=2571750 RepID=A0A4D7CXB1_9ENTE|nr:hypothetical protein [Vagococcus zengguangii]QCI86506.1 hypothetical protein FA707_05770 [Vagococcus zengguangii]TLG81244.1 hypothetical protein FE258_01845 [Vagococcus zengguangii]
MDNTILIGAIIMGVGLIIQAVTARWSWKLGGYYKSSNKPLSFFGWCLIIVGVIIVVLKAKANGQLD